MKTMQTISDASLDLPAIIEATIRPQVKPCCTLKEITQDNIATFGHAYAAKIAKKKMCFTHFYWLAFGCLPRI